METRFSLKTVLAVSFFFTLTVLVFGPASLYFPNSLEFNFSFSQVIHYLAILVSVIVLSITFILWLLKNQWYKKILSILFVCSILLWIQGNLLVWNYGPLDGREIPWNKMVLRGLFDSGIWILFVILTFVKWEMIFKIARKASLVFIVIQLISVSILIINAPEIPSFKRFYIDEAEKYNFSSKSNVIFVMMDTYQTDIFQEIINEEDYYKDVFKGFTYFRNTLSAFPKTYTSVPSFLTSHQYDNSITMQDFIQNAYTSKMSLPKTLKDHGFRVELYPYPGTEKSIYYDDTIASNIKKRAANQVAFKDLAYLIDLTLFRFLPHFTKPWIYNHQKWLLKRIFQKREKNITKENRQVEDVHGVRNFSEEALRLRDVRFINDFLHQSKVDDNKGIFKYYHLNGLHRPLVLDKQVNIVKMSYNKRSSFKTQGKACLEIIKLFLEKLKSMGIFDQSLIVVLGDHGCADYAYGVDIGTAGFIDHESASEKIPSHIKASGLPLLLVKPLGRDHVELEISDAPVSLTDLPSTVFYNLGISRENQGPSLFKIDPNSPRKRKFYYYNWNGWNEGYLYHMREYVINGHSWLDSSWQERGIIKPASSEKLYQMGEPVYFRREGNGTRYQGIGWHSPGKKDTWTREKQAFLFFNIKPPENNFVLILKLKPFLVRRKCEKQVLNILVNENIVKKLVITKPGYQTFKIEIAKELVPGSELNITFDIPTAVSPVDLGTGNDVRDLGIALKSVVVEDIGII